LTKGNNRAKKMKIRGKKLHPLQMAQAWVERAPCYIFLIYHIECGCTPYFWALLWVESNLCKYILIHGIMKEPVEQKRIRDDYGPGSVRTSSHFIFLATYDIKCGCTPVLLGLAFTKSTFVSEHSFDRKRWK
jgi:hypothetical protein